MKNLFPFLVLFTNLCFAEERPVKLIERESDFCAGKKLNPPHCQEDGNCYHFLKKPIYPREALKDGVEGYAKIKFDTNESGCTLNHEVVVSHPIDDFGKAAIQSAKYYRYTGPQKGIVVTISFGLDE
ncbi:energy transducer TonB [Microbulbifer sp. TRSA007]|uniref:energy transducer TonB n=1 Tax=Microbulbifer sp. TRSA007 TaxID=3243384 RepID=UPI00403925BD